MSGKEKRTFKGTVQELEEKIESYFEKCDKEKIPYTVTELALHLGFNCRQDLLNYQDKYKDPNGISYFDPIKKAKARIEASLERRLQMGGNNTAGLIFVLKNNYGWKDKQEIETTGTQSIDVKFNIPRPQKQK